MALKAGLLNLRGVTAGLLEIPSQETHRPTSVKSDHFVESTEMIGICSALLRPAASPERSRPGGGVADCMREIGDGFPKLSAYILAHAPVVAFQLAA